MCIISKLKLGKVELSQETKKIPILEKYNPMTIRRNMIWLDMKKI